MEQIVKEGRAYYRASDVAELWGLKERTVREYASKRVGKLQGCIKSDGLFLVPANAVRPITKPIAQALMWEIVQYQNEPDRFFDLSEYGIAADQVDAVLKELQRLGYLRVPVGWKGSAKELLLSASITAAGFSLIMYKQRMKSNPLEGISTIEAFGLAFGLAQTVMQLVQLMQVTP